MGRPDILFIMTDQQRFDTIAALGNSHIYTPNIDRLVRRGISFSNAYATCPVCVAARYTIRTGCEPPTTRVFTNAKAKAVAAQAMEMEARCGSYIGRTMSRIGYRTFGVGKFHTNPWNEDLGFETLWRCEETYHPPNREGDDYGSWLAREHPEFDFLEQPMGERTEMFYLPQRSALPANLGGEWWTADRTIDEIAKSDDSRPFFGFISFIGPHPPVAPPIPFNRMYDPDRIPEPILGNIEEDHLDEEIAFMRHAIWADAVNPALTKIVRARYYGEITYLDFCVGRILDAIEARPNSEDVLICFFSDHGDLLGDHHGWQKQNFFEAACRIPLLLSWPATLPAGTARSELISLADLFAIATGAAGACETREGINVLTMLHGECAPRQHLIGMVEVPGSHDFKIMVLTDDWKYIFMANGGREQLFNRKNDPNELSNCVRSSSQIRSGLYALAVKACKVPGANDALEGEKLRAFPFRERPPIRIYQFDRSRGIVGFPDKPQDALKHWTAQGETVGIKMETTSHGEDLGLGLKPGDAQYRAYVGPPEDYDLIAAMTFNLLTTLGLRQHHSLLDIGCGSLRVGRLLIPYLNRGKYVGVEPNEWLVEEGIRRELGETLVQIKRPTFFFSDSPNTITHAKVAFDFAVAQSIFSHCGLDLIKGWLSAISGSLAQDGALVATFLIGEQDSVQTGWIYPDCVNYRPIALERAAKDVDLRFEILDWKHPRQTWALFAAPGFDSTWLKDRPLNWNAGLKQLLSKKHSRD